MVNAGSDLADEGWAAKAQRKARVPNPEHHYTLKNKDERYGREFGFCLKRGRKLDFKQGSDTNPGTFHITLVSRALLRTGGG